MGLETQNYEEDLINMLIEKGATKSLPYNKPKWFKGTEEAYAKASKEQDYSMGYNLEFSAMLLKEEEYVKVFKDVDVVSLLQTDMVEHTVNIDLEVLSNKIMDKVIKNSQQLFNQKLEVHQPNMPLFQYNDYVHVIDYCTTSLQDDYIDKGYRVVCVCPQPDQRRPDYILARYVSEEGNK